MLDGPFKSARPPVHRAWTGSDELALRLVEGPGPRWRSVPSTRPRGGGRRGARDSARGSETTSVALTWALRELARDASLAATVAEQGETLAERVFAETLRVYPPAWYIGRVAVTDTELAGEPIAAGTVVLSAPTCSITTAATTGAGALRPGSLGDGTAAAARAFTYLAVRCRFSALHRRGNRLGRGPRPAR